ncbi:hypothetical protein BGX27_003186 [Mortierella sp. AM989]|nr:hypothetical protein BGX27_003186 [Mortierella sp. AM989]
MFWNKNKSTDSTLQLQVISPSPEMNPADTSSSARTAQYVALQDIDHVDETVKASKSKRPATVAPIISADPCSSGEQTIDQCTWPGLAAHIPLKTSAFKLVANFDGYSTGHYKVCWRVKAQKEFSIPNGLHFVVNVSYDVGLLFDPLGLASIADESHLLIAFNNTIILLFALQTEPDISGTLDVIMPPYKLNMLVKERWYNLVLEEKLVIQPHLGKSHVQLILCNNENVDRVDYFGLIIEHVEIRPVALMVENQARISNFIVPRAAVPNFSIDTTKLLPGGQSSSMFPSSAPVTRISASKGSRFLASLAQSKNAAYITVWDMSIIKNPYSPYKDLRKLYEQCATVAIDYPGIGDLAIGLSISTNGDQIAIFQEPKIGQWAEGSEVEKASFPFKLFNNPMVPQSSLILDMGMPSDTKANEKSSAPETPSDVMTLQEVQLKHEKLRSFVGFGEFLPETKKSDWEKNDVNSALNSTAEDEGDEDVKASNSKSGPSSVSSMFVACNGLYLDVYEISSDKKWKRIHVITLSDLLPTLSRRITVKLMMDSISSNTFMWLEDGGHSCTIWNLLTGSNITHISSIEDASFKGSTFRGHSKMAISPHESIVALASIDGSLTTYFANTGMAIDDRNFPGYKIEHVGFHAQDDQLFIILRNSVTFELSARILDTLQLKSETAMNQIPIPSIDTTILAFFYVKGLWNRGIICEADATKINFYVSYQPTSTKIPKNSPTTIKAEPEDVVYESLVQKDVQYQLVTGIHRELLPEGDGVSYWVLRVEVVKEDLSNRTQQVIFSFVPEPWMRITTSDVAHPENLQSAFFVPCGTRFAVVGVQTLQIWNLPTTDNSKCSLQFIWSQPKNEEEFGPGGSAYKSRRVRDYYSDVQGINLFMDTETANTMAEIKMSEKFKRSTIPVPGIGTIGARHAILYCFRSIHLLAASYAFSYRESKRVTRNDAQVTFTFEDHAEAILRFSREHINRMMSIGVYSPNRRRSSPNKSSHQRSSANKDDEPTFLDTIGPIPVEETRKSTVAGNDVTVHGNANRHDGIDQAIEEHHGNNHRGGNQHGRSTDNVKARNSTVVTILTLLLDQKYLQRANHVFVEGLLNTANGDWIPRDNKPLNPIKRAIEAKNVQLVQAFIDYCIKNAKKYHPSYLMPAVQCLNELSDRYPDLLANMLRRASYVPVHNYSYIVSHAVIANPQYRDWLTFKLKFWNLLLGKKWEKSNTVNDYAKPVFSLRSQLPFRSSTYLLNIETSARELRSERFPQQPDVGIEEKKQMMSEYSHKIYVAPFPKLSMYGPYQPWYKGLAAAKSAFVDIAGQDYFDSPAMVATLEFKWHKFGFNYWLMRFCVAMTFFFLVLVITAQQIQTSPLPKNSPILSPDENMDIYMDGWRPVFEATIGVGCILIVYELVQFLDSPKKYIKSPYNYTDLAAYISPVIGCILFLNEKPDEKIEVWVMSFAILALHMNILFELRVIKQLGIAVNIILNITRRIVWFFLIFALFLVSFTHALLHLLHTRKYREECIETSCEDDDYPDGYPKGFFKALSTTYFFLAGRWDPVDALLDRGETSFHIMMVLFFFATTVVLLNILIALMNDAYEECRNEGQLAWLKQWSEVIAEVEMFLMSQSTRQNRNFFPDYIYYGANEQEAELYESKFSIGNKSNLSIENRFLIDSVSNGQNASQLGQRAILRDVQSLSKDLERMKQTQDGLSQDLAKLTELMGAFLAQTTIVAPMSPGSEPLSQVSPIENDPPVSGASPTTPPGTAMGTPSTSGIPGKSSTPGGAGGITGGVNRFSAAAAAGSQRRASNILKHPMVPSARLKVSASQTESPTTYSGTVHFNTPKSSIEASPVSADSGGGLSELPEDEALAISPESSLPTKASSSAPYRDGTVHESESDAFDRQSSLKRRLQQKLALIHTMDDVLKSHQKVENNASHPLYVRASGPRLEEEDDELYESDEERVETEIKNITPVHHQSLDVPSSSSRQQWDIYEHHADIREHHTDIHEHPQRTQSEIVLPTVPHESMPLHVHPPHKPRQDPPKRQDQH